MSAETKTGTESTNGEIEAERSFEARYGPAIVSRGIATVPALLLRWQSGLRLKDGHTVLLITVLSFYRSAGTWPSVSIEKMANWRGVSWTTVEKEVKELERLGYLVRPGRDPKHGGSYFFDLSGLLDRLGKLASAEERADELRRAQVGVLEGALPDLSTDGETNRDLKQKTEAEKEKDDENRERDRAHKETTETEDGPEKPLIENVNSSQVQKVGVEDGYSNPIETKPISRLMRYALPSKGSRR